VHTVEQFKTYSQAPVTIGWPAVIGLGEKHRLQVPIDKPDRYIWIAAGKYLQDVAANRWWTQCRITFLLSGNPVGSLLYANHADALSAASVVDTGRPLFRKLAAAQGPQPSLVYYGVNNAAAVVQSMELPCFFVRVRCDVVIYEIELGYSVTGGANTDEFLTGFRIMSTI
jgi:hypothetical protein